MRLNSVISLFLSFLIIISGFITICHDEDESQSDVHFIVQPCETHDCSRNTEPPCSSDKECQHRFCSDQSIQDEYFHNGLTHLQTLAAPAIVIGDIPLSSEQPKPLLSITIPPHIEPLRTTVLRI